MKLFHLLAITFLVILSSQFAFSKTTSPKGSNQANTQAKEGKSESEKTVYEDSALKVTLKKESILNAAGSKFQKYKLTFNNLSDKKISLKGDVYNRASKQKTLAYLTKYSPNPGYSVAAGYGPIAIGVNPSAGTVGVITPFSAVGARKANNAYQTQLSSASKLTDDGFIEKDIQPTLVKTKQNKSKQNIYTLSFVINPSISAEPKYVFAYEIEDQNPQLFYLGFDEANAAKILESKTVDKYAFLDNNLSNKKAGIYLQDENINEPKLIDASEETTSLDDNPNKFTSTGFHIYVYKNLKGEPNSENKWNVYSYVKAKNAQKRKLESSTPIKAELKEIKPGLFELIPATTFKAGKLYELKQTGEKASYQFVIN